LISGFINEDIIMVRSRVLIVGSVVGLLVIGASFVIARGSGRAPIGADASTDSARSPVAPSTRSTSALIAAPGRVEPISEEIEVGIELSGRLREVLVEEGDRVTRGQVIARLESADFAARLASAEARLSLARAELERLINGARAEERREANAVVDQAEATLLQSDAAVERIRSLYAQRVVSRDELDQAERNARVARARVDESRERFNTINADARLDERRRAEAAVKLAQAQVAEARALVEKTDIKSPLDGVVLKKHHRAGESLSTDAPDSIVVTLGDTRVLRVRVEVDETDVADVALGRKAWVTADAYGTRRFTGHVVRVGETLGRQRVRMDRASERTDTRVLETLVELDLGNTLPVGLRVDAFIERAPQTASARP
jgi:HlyD family secretion protein